MEEHFIYQSLFIICTLGSIICDDGGTHSKHFFTFDGSGDAIFSCNGSDIINITDIHLSNHPTDCPRNMCNLTVSDRNHIEMCNGNSSCEIPIDELSPCIKDKGFYSVDYSCQRNAMHCDFEDECEWFVEENDWYIVYADDHDAVLDKDHTTGSNTGHYWYVETEDSSKSFHSEPVHGSFNQCLSFHYYIHEEGDSIEIYIEHTNGTSILKTEIPKSDNSIVLWDRKTLAINGVMDYQIVIKAKGGTQESKFAVDDFRVINRDCQELKENGLHCNFDDGVCEWFSVVNGWSIVKAEDHYPTNDHTTVASKGKYIYVGPSDSYQSIYIKQIRGGMKQCLTFYYYIHEVDDSIVLQIQHMNGTFIQTVEIFRTVGNTVLWERKAVSIINMPDYNVIIEARGHDTRSKFAVDDISIIEKECNELRECDFESDYCNWIGSDHWRRKMGSTDTFYTGPWTDHTTTRNGYYVYMEASEMSEEERAFFISPIYSGRGDTCLVVWYYMYGTHMGSLIVYTDFNSKRSELFNISGNQGRLWHMTSIDMHTNGDFKIIIEGQRGSGRKSDIAIDDISLHDGNCAGIVENQQTCKSVDENVELNECSNYYLSNIDVYFDPSKELCSDILNQTTNPVCNRSGDNVICNASDLAMLRQSCSSLTSIVIGYTCTGIETLTLANKKSNAKDSTGVIIGAAVGLLLVVGVIVGILYIIHRKLPDKGHNSNSKGDYPATKCLKNRQTPNDGLSNSQTTVNPSYDHSFSKTKPDELVKNKDIIYTNIQEQKGKMRRQDDYKVLDPAVTGFNRTNQNGYELSSPINDTVDDNYAESGVGVYDISGNSRHQVKDTIYDHSVDDTYDTSSRGRQEDLGDYTYNHVFGKQTEDEYDIAGS